MRLFRVMSVLGLALGGALSVAAPAQAAVGPWLQVAAGETHTCGISTAKNLYCWGSNNAGQSGDGTTEPRLGMHRVGAAGVWSRVSAGLHHTCGITTAKNLYCWGSNASGQVGNGTNNSPRLSLYRVGGTGVWSSVSAGESYTCGITTAENLYCWGFNSTGQTGDGTVTTPRLSLFRVGAAGVWSSVTTGGRHTCGITTAKNLYCWGSNNSGQVGDGTIDTPRLSLYRVGGTGVWSSVTAEGRHTCGITTGKNLYCWGFNSSGQVGDGTIATPRLSLYRVGGAGVWSSVTTGDSHTCGITTGKNLYCWGSNNTGQTGDGTITTPRLSLHRVGAAGVWSSVGAGAAHTCGITAAENLYCWGLNSDAQVGDGTNNTPRLSLFRVQ